MARIVLGSDHWGLEIREHLREHLTRQGHTCIDVGAAEYDPADDYPVYGEKVGRAVAGGEADIGIAICGTGAGISMAAGRVRGVRATACSEPYTAEMTRRHNNCNVLAMGALVVSTGLATMIADAFVNAQFEGGRHQRRVDMVEAIEG